MSRMSMVQMSMNAVEPVSYMGASCVGSAMPRACGQEA